MNRNKVLLIRYVGHDAKWSNCNNGSKRASIPLATHHVVVMPTVLITGITVDEIVNGTRELPPIEKIVAFPSTIFVDKKGEIRRISIGFDGPATGQHHVQFKKELDHIVTGLLEEK